MKVWCTVSPVTIQGISTNLLRVQSQLVNPIGLMQGQLSSPIRLLEGSSMGQPRSLLKCSANGARNREEHRNVTGSMTSRPGLGLIYINGENGIQVSHSCEYCSHGLYRCAIRVTHEIHMNEGLVHSISCNDSRN